MMLGKHFLKGREEKEMVSEMKKEVPPYVMKSLSIVVYKIIVYSKLEKQTHYQTNRANKIHHQQNFTRHINRSSLREEK